MRTLLLSITILVLSCTKNADPNQTCWTCKVGINQEVKKVCNDGENPKFQDANGNDLNSICNKD